MRFELTRDSARFIELAGAMLASRIDLNVPATVLGQVARGEYGGSAPLFACGLEQAGEVAFVALRTPPWGMLASAIDPADASELMALWLVEDPELPGVSGEPAAARALAAAWRQLTGASTQRRLSAAMHVLTEVDVRARGASGALRPAERRERELLIAWEEAFVLETGAGVPGQGARTIDRRIATGMQQVWDDGGPVSTLAVHPAIAGTVRIVAVYTPSELRGRGYAGSLVAAASRRALSAGAERCMLFTDLANPTSNRLYASLGFGRIGDWEEHAFG